MTRRSSLLLVLGSLAGCAFHDWNGYSSGDVTGPGDGGGVAEAAATDAPIPPAIVPDADTLDPYGKVIAADGPVAWYRFEEAPGATFVADVLGGHPAQVTGDGATPAFRQPGLVGNGVLLDGKTIFDVGDFFDFAGKVPFTLEAWVKAKNINGDQRLFYKRDDYVTHGGYVFYLAGDLTPHFEASGPSGQEVSMSAWSDTPIPTGAWVHVVMVVSYAGGKGNSFVYTNGALGNAHGFDNVNDLLDTTQHLGLGERAECFLDEFAIYDKALTQKQILEHYVAGGGQ